MDDIGNGNPAGVNNPENDAGSSIEKQDDIQASKNGFWGKIMKIFMAATVAGGIGYGVGSNSTKDMEMSTAGYVAPLTEEGKKLICSDHISKQVICPLIEYRDKNISQEDFDSILEKYIAFENKGQNKKNALDREIFSMLQKFLNSGYKTNNVDTLLRQLIELGYQGALTIDPDIRQGILDKGIYVTLKEGILVVMENKEQADVSLGLSGHLNILQGILQDNPVDGDLFRVHFTGYNKDITTLRYKNSDLSTKLSTTKDKKLALEEDLNKKIEEIRSLEAIIQKNKKLGEEKIAQIKKHHAEEIKTMQDKFDKKTNVATLKKNEEIAKMETEHAEEIKRKDETHDSIVNGLNEQHEKSIQERDNTINLNRIENLNLQRKHDKAIDITNATLEENMENSKKLGELQDHYKELLKNNEQLTATIAANDTTIKDLENKNKEMSDKIDSLKGTSTIQTKKIHELNEEIKKLKKKLDNLIEG